MKYEYELTKSKCGWINKRTFQEDYVIVIFQNFKVGVVKVWRAI